MQNQTEAIENLRGIISVGDRVYTILRHRSASGMTRWLDLYIIKDNTPRRITWLAAAALGYTYDFKREALKVQHHAERQAKDKSLSARWDNEQRARAARIRKGFAGAWDILTGRYFRTRKQNEMEAKFARERDSHERHALIRAQHKDRQALQELIKENRRKEAERILGLYRDAARFRRMREGEADPGPNLSRQGLCLMAA